MEGNIAQNSLFLNAKNYLYFEPQWHSGWANVGPFTTYRENNACGSENYLK